MDTIHEEEGGFECNTGADVKLVQTVQLVQCRRDVVSGTESFYL